MSCLGDRMQRSLGRPAELDLDQRFHTRECTYKDYGKAQRSFWKYVAKQQLYYPLRWVFQWRHNRHEHWDWERVPVRGFTTYVYGNGYGWRGMPAFRNWRSSAYDAWNREFERHREKWEEAARAKRGAAWNVRVEGWNRQALHNNSPAIKTLRLLAAGSAFRK